MKTNYVRVVGCFVEHNGQLLMLQRSKNDFAPGMWGLPAGKVESGESDLQATVRELREETGIAALPDDMRRLGSHGFSDSKVDRIIILPIHHLMLDEEPRVILSSEHDDFAWLTPREVIALEQKIHGIDALLYRYGLI